MIYLKAILILFTFYVFWEDGMGAKYRDNVETIAVHYAISKTVVLLSAIRLVTWLIT